MAEQSNKLNFWERVNISSDRLKSFFIMHLDRIYSAKMHLVAKLPLLTEEVEFSELRNAIFETVENVEKQIARMQMIYTLLDADVSTGSAQGLSGLIIDAFDAIREQRGEPALQDLSIIFYLQNIESVEMASFQILQMAAVRFDNKQVSLLLQENYDEAKSDRALYLLISSKYMVN